MALAPVYSTSDHSLAVLDNPTAYAGTVVVLGESEEWTVQRAAEWIECGPIIQRYGRWALTKFGIEFLGMEYTIHRDRVHEPDWMSHLQRKTWFNAADRCDLTLLLDEARQRWPKRVR